MAQVFVNGLIAGVYIALVGCSFFFIYRIQRFFHFGHAAFITLGAYLTRMFLDILPSAPWLGIILGILATGFISILIERCLFRKLSDRSASALVLLLVSLGVYIVLENSIAVVFGDRIRLLSNEQVRTGIALGPIVIARTQITIATVSTFAIVASAAALRYTPLGQGFRAVGEDPLLAEIAGIPSTRIATTSFFWGSALAGVAGCLQALDGGMTPSMGMRPFMVGVVAFVISGQTGLGTVFVAGVFLGVLRNFATWYFHTQWQDALVFTVLLVFLVVRPSGVKTLESRA